MKFNKFDRIFCTICRYVHTYEMYLSTNSHTSHTHILYAPPKQTKIARPNFSEDEGGSPVNELPVVVVPAASVSGAVMGVRKL